MKSQIHFPPIFHFGHALVNDRYCATDTSEFEISKSFQKMSLKKIKANLNKLSPLHWYDGVWDNLDFKM